MVLLFHMQVFLYKSAIKIIHYYLTPSLFFPIFVYMEIDIGEIIKEEFEKSGLSATQFARMINKERSIVYHLFKRRSIDTDLLYKICSVLRIDLFRLYSEHLREEHIVEGESKPSTSLAKRRVMVEVELTEEEYHRLLHTHLNP